MEVLTEIAKDVVVPSCRFLCSYIYCMIKDTVKFQSNLDILEKEMKDLLVVKDEVEKETNFYRIRKEVAEKVKEIGLRKEGRPHLDDLVVYHPKHRGVVEIPGDTFNQDQKTSSKILDDIMRQLSDDGIRRIGVWGMGGVGKSTLVRTLNNKLISSRHPFSIVIFVSVLENSEYMKNVQKNVQKKIAQRLNLEVKAEESPDEIAIGLCSRLKHEEKFLLILDDVWEEIDLDKLGVPQPEDHKGSKIILTTRSFHVCRHMSTDVEVKVAILNDEEAWQLFGKNAGDVASSKDIKPIATAIARECCGLPLALVTMGADMRRKEKVEQWEHTLKELQRSMYCPPHIEEKVYQPLKRSYNSLEGKMKYCFLYCSLFSKGFSIAISELVYCWQAEGFLDEENYEDSLNRVIDLIENLKDSCLLEDGADEDTVKMHNVVRDVAIWIASSSEDGCKSLVRSGIGLSKMPIDKLNDNSLKRVSFMNNEIVTLPDCVVQCSNASTLLLQGNTPIVKVPEEFLQGFEALRILNMGGTSIHSMPLSLLQLSELRALLLGGCSYLEKLSPLDKLIKLQVLDLSATSISELPRWMENLSNLKHLNLSSTKYLETIEAGIISGLSCLEALDMTCSHFSFRLKRDRVPKEMACFEDLKCLKRLLNLSIRLEGIPCLSSEDISWINKLKRFQFFIGPQANSVPNKHGKRMVLSLSGMTFNSEERIGPLLKAADSLHLKKCCGLSDMVSIDCIDYFAGLKSLSIENCSDSVWQGQKGNYDPLPNLEELYLRNLDYGESISELLNHLGLRFPALKSLEVEGCSKMEYILSYGYFIEVLPNLKVIKVRNCDKLGDLFSYVPGKLICPDPIVPKLRILELEWLPKLRTFCRDEETWPLLEQLYVFKCNGVRKLPLTAQNAKKIKEIRGESQWWNALQWQDGTVFDDMASVVGEVVVAAGRVLCGSIYSMIKDIVKFQSNLDILEKEMKALLAVKDEVKNETELAEREGKVVKPLVTKWVEEVEELLLKDEQIHQAAGLFRQLFTTFAAFPKSEEVATTPFPLILNDTTKYESTTIKYSSAFRLNKMGREVGE
ncbi:disease resistance protein At4g27190-like [Corylus avellana]|uniref:disease resistance protein At4g27190-like n=1 Tax=Corylus avellana TaxID=13451 RepID=UPI00286C7F5B|nr:disease resistance protein At4g27190-like [Corylus avellana]